MGGVRGVSRMGREEECELVRVLPDGTPVLRIGGVEREARVEGVELVQPPPPLYFEMLEKRLPRIGRPLRCVVRGETTGGRVLVRLFYFGWQDKSGDVWVDLAQTLIDEGLARVSAEQFPEREEYLRREREAKAGGERGSGPRED